MATLQWFSFDLNGGGFELHDTEEAARNYALSCIQLAMADGGIDSFNTGIESIFWGRLDIRQNARVVGDRVELVDETE